MTALIVTICPLFLLFSVGCELDRRMNTNSRPIVPRKSFTYDLEIGVQTGKIHIEKYPFLTGIRLSFKRKTFRGFSLLFSATGPNSKLSPEDKFTTFKNYTLESTSDAEDLISTESRIQLFCRKNSNKRPGFEIPVEVNYEISRRGQRDDGSQAYLTTKDIKICNKSLPVKYFIAPDLELFSG